jgi:SpoVK/Ycf46/Vps4 family AAA+-type ATPase
VNLFDLIINDKATVELSDIVLPEGQITQINLFIKEHQYVDQLLSLGLPVNNKILLHGASGCGKTMTAKAISKALQKPIYILNLSNVVCARIGETSQNIKQIFEKAGRDRAVLFLDEFDQIGKSRGNDDNDVGEMRRLVNTLIQLIDYYPNNAILIAATNHLGIVDEALQRRFQLKLSYEKPNRAQLDELYKRLDKSYEQINISVPRVYDRSFAEARDYYLSMLKAQLIEQWQSKESQKDK